MFLFIAVIFIAELIIAVSLVVLIIKADKKVLQINSEVTQIKPKLRKGLEDFKDIIHMLKDKQILLFDLIRRKRNQYVMNIVKSILFYVLLFLLKGKCKKAASICNGILLVKDIWDGISA